MRAKAASPARRKLYAYWAVVAVYTLVLGWWLYFFWRQAEWLLVRMARAGVELGPAEQDALRAAANESMRMFLFEGVFLGLMLTASVALVLRSLDRELAVHRQQRNFLSSVTHELKSPLASARLYVESLLLGRAEGEKRQRYLEHALQDLDRLRSMVDDLLSSARLSSTGPRLETERLDLSAFARERLARLAEEQVGARPRIEVMADEPVAVEADPAALETILRNLLGNSIKYGGEEPRIELCVKRSGDQALLALRDHGPGLAGADPERIFDPFVRGGDENVRTQPGVGLGLFIVRELARAQGGAARAREAQGGGLVIEVNLPLAADRRENGPGTALPRGQGGRSS